MYSIVYTDRARSQFVEVYKCTEDSAMEQPWQGRVVSLYQLATLLVIPAILAMGCYQAVIRVLWKYSRLVFCRVRVVLIAAGLQEHSFTDQLHLHQQQHAESIHHQMSSV